MINAVEDLKFAFKSLFRDRGFLAATITCMAVGVGPTAAAFALVNALFLRNPAGVKEPEHVYRLLVTRRSGNVRMEDGSRLSYPDYLALRAQPGTVAGVAAYAAYKVDAGVGPNALRLNTLLVSPEYFTTLGVKAALGRLLKPAGSGTEGKDPEAVISFEFWKRHFEGDSSVLGKTLVLSRVEVPIVGIAPPRFRGLDQQPTDLWLPISLIRELDPGFPWLTAPFAGWITIALRLEPRVSERQAERAAAGWLRHAAELQPGLDPKPLVRLGSVNAAGGTLHLHATRVVVSLWGCASALLLVATANAASLLLARGLRRQREFAVCFALGLSSGRFTRQLAFEASALGVLGAMASLAFVLAASPIAKALPIPQDLPLIDLQVLGFATALSVLVACAAATVPARQMMRNNLAGVLHSRDGTLSRVQANWQARLVIMQLAFAVVLLVAASQFVQSFRRLWKVDTGMDPEKLLVLSFDLTPLRLTPEKKAIMYRAMLDKLMAVAGVERASAAAYVAFREVSGGAVTLPGRDVSRPRTGPYVNYVSADYFSTIGTPLRAGRAFLDSDGTGAEPVTIINEAMALSFWGRRGVIDECVHVVSNRPESPDCTRVVGVVETGKYLELEEQPIAHYFLPLSRAPESIFPKLFVRSSRDPRTLTTALRQALASVEPKLPFVEIETMGNIIAPQVRPSLLGARVLLLIAATALFLSALGIYATLSYIVSQRRGEIGVRLAFGATSRSIILSVVRRSLSIAMIGLITGLAVSMITTRIIRGYLVGSALPATWTYVVILLLLGTVGVVASAGPAIRASRLPPALALRGHT